MMTDRSRQGHRHRLTDTILDPAARLHLINTALLGTVTDGEQDKRCCVACLPFVFCKDVALRVECTQVMGEKGMNMVPDFPGTR